MVQNCLHIDKTSKNPIKLRKMNLFSASTYVGKQRLGKKIFVKVSEESD